MRAPEILSWLEQPKVDIALEVVGRKAQRVHQGHVRAGQRQRFALGSRQRVGEFAEIAARQRAERVPVELSPRVGVSDFRRSATAVEERTSSPKSESRRPGMLVSRSSTHSASPERASKSRLSSLQSWCAMRRGRDDHGRIRQHPFEPLAGYGCNSVEQVADVRLGRDASGSASTAASRTLAVV